MSKRFALIALAALPLAACSGQAGNNNAAANAGAPVPAAAAAAGNATRESIALQPGEWEVTLSGDGMPQRPPIRICITPEDSARGAQDMVGGGSTTDSGLSCDRGGIGIAGGRITGTSVCRGEQLEARVTMDGTITPTAFDVSQQVSTTINGASHDRSIRNVGRRVGECRPGQAEAQARARAAAAQAAANRRPVPAPGNAQ